MVRSKSRSRDEEETDQARLLSQQCVSESKPSIPHLANNAHPDLSWSMRALVACITEGS
jgi:hypothetical protein